MSWLLAATGDAVQDFGGAHSLLKSTSFLGSTGIDEMKLEIRCLEGTAPVGDGFQYGSGQLQKKGEHIC